MTIIPGRWGRAGRRRSLGGLRGFDAFQKKSDVQKESSANCVPMLPMHSLLRPSSRPDPHNF